MAEATEGLLDSGDAEHQFEQWLDQHCPGFDLWAAKKWCGKDDLLELATGIMRTVHSGLLNPDVAPSADGDIHIALSDCRTHDGLSRNTNESPYLCFVKGGLIREDHIYDAFPGRQKLVREVLEQIGQKWLVRGVFKPSERLRTAWHHSQKVSLRSMSKGQLKKHGGTTATPNTLSPAAACAATANGNRLAGELLHQIRWWWVKKEIWRYDRLWIAAPRERWAAELDFSLDQYKRALQRLKGLGLVETRQSPWANRNWTFLRTLTYVGLPTNGPRIEAEE